MHQDELHHVEAREASYWDEQAAHLTEDQLRHETVTLDATNRRRLALLGDVRGKRLLDVGCGTGLWSVLLAERGAEVWAVDISPGSIAVTRRRASLCDVSERVHSSVMSALELDFADGFFDLVHGQDIIHHLDAAAFGKEVARVLKPGGRAVFSENCANNSLLMFARNNLCGRWGIPRWSSDDEYPLTKERLNQFGQFFESVHVEYPEFLFFHYLDAKVFGYRNRPINRLCHGLDANIHFLLPFMRKYSYRQLICCHR